MNRKINKFTGRIDFSKDSPDKISKTLDELSTYLKSYNEDEAAKIIEDFKGQKKSPMEKGSLERLEKSNKERNSLLQDIKKAIVKIKDDLINEQNVKAKTSKANWNNKPKVIQKPKETKESKDLKNLKKNPLQWLKEAILGSLIGSLISKLLKPLKWIVKGLLGGLFKAGRFGFALIAGALKLLLKGGGLLLKPIKDMVSKIWESKVSPKIQELKNSFKSKVKDTAGKAKSKAKDVADKGWSKITKFFDGVKVKSSNIMASANATKIKEAATKAKNFVSSGVSKAAGIAKEKWEKIASKVKSIGSKIVGYFKKSSGKSKVASRLASRMPKALGKFASKFVPGLGIALLAYDVYAAAKKSNSVVSFAVNLIDGVSGGLISLGLGALLEDFDGENLGAYVDNIIKGHLDLNDEDAAEAMKAVEGLNLDSMAKGSLDILNQVSSMSMDGTSKEIETLKEKLKGNPNQESIINEYKRLTTLVSSGKISVSEAQTRFTEFTKKEIQSGIVDPATGIVMDNGGNPLPLQNTDTNLEAHDVVGATQAQAASLTLQASADLAVQAASKSAKGYEELLINSQTNNVHMNPPPLQTIVQG